MDKEELKKLLIEHGVPENQVEEMADKFSNETDELQRQHETGEHTPIEIAPGIYLTHLLQNEPDWRKRAQLAAASLSRNLGVD